MMMQWGLNVRLVSIMSRGGLIFMSSFLRRDPTPSCVVDEPKRGIHSKYIQHFYVDVQLE